MANVTSFERFMRAHKTAQKENGFYAPTASMVDEKGNPLQWEFRHLDSKTNDEIRDECTRDIQVTGKPNLYRQKLDGTRYLLEVVAASAVVPDLHNADLQDSYGVHNAIDLIYTMVDDPGELQALETWVSEFQGFTKSLQDDINTAKN